MKLTRFKVQHYRCILDSGWIDVEDLTVLVGKNESGKTSLLKALCQFNPLQPEPYHLSRDWPRGVREERSEKQVVCTAEFALAPEEMKRLQELTALPVTSNRVQVSRDYGGRFTAACAVATQRDDADGVADALPEPALAVSEEFREAALACRAEALRLAHEGRYAELAEIKPHQERALAPRGNHKLHQPNEDEFRSQYFTKLSELSGQLAETRPLESKATDYLVSRLPAFVFMDEYRAFNGSAQLGDIKHRMERKHLNADDETFLMLLSLAGLDFEKEHGKGAHRSGKAREDRQYDLSDAEAVLNRKLENHWGQLRYQVEFRTDGQQFMTFVKGEDGALVRLEERSRGFQWFFSFDLLLMHQTQGRLKDCVILLDEPGLHLHPEGQRDLLARLEEHARHNTIIYTTHLPGMIDLATPERIRVINHSETGTVVSEDLAAAEPIAREVLQASLSVGCLGGWIASEQNLVLEAGMYWVLSEVAGLLRRSGREVMPFDVMMVPAGSVGETVYLAALMLGEQRDVAALFESDDSGRTARRQFEQGWLPKYQGNRSAGLDLADAIGTPGRECGIEELFTESFYVARVQQVYEKQLLAAGVRRLILPPGDRLATRAAAALQALGLPFHKRAVCRRIAADIRQMRAVNELPEGARRLAENLFKTVANLMAR
ncbi:MAG: AAA family ATPase [Verrucomicrobiota bacterium]